LRIEETFTIGLYGKWGNGKTSLINLMVNEIERLNASKQDVEPMHIVRFEPWVFSDSNQLMSQFFIHLANELRGKGSAVISNIGEKLEKYAWLWQVSKVVPWEVMVPLLGQGAREMADAAQNVTENNGRTMHGDAMSADILTQKKAIVDLLEKQEDRILIVIDDIDRLNNDQIRQVFQLVTAVANFPNVTYLLSFDKEIVVNALAEVQKGNGEEYLE
jgi:predicted KAP-like P-loop ATPase